MRLLDGEYIGKGIWMSTEKWKWNTKQAVDNASQKWQKITMTDTQHQSKFNTSEFLCDTLSG